MTPMRSQPGARFWLFLVLLAGAFALETLSACWATDWRYLRILNRRHADAQLFSSPILVSGVACAVYATATLWLLTLGIWVLLRSRSRKPCRTAAWLGFGTGTFLLMALSIVGPRLGYDDGFFSCRYSCFRAGGECCAERTLLDLARAEEDFRRESYANDLAQLGDRISPALASGRKEGYTYGTLRTCDEEGQTDRSLGFAYVAAPEQYGDTGRRTYIMNQTGEIWFQDLGGKSQTDWPRDLVKEGWTLFSYR